MKLPFSNRRARGYSLLEIVISIALMAVMARALGNLVSVSTYQALKARVDQRVRLLLDREVNFYTLVPYTELVPAPSPAASPAASPMKVLDPANTNFGFKTDPNTLPTGATAAYDSFEGTSTAPMYLSNPVGGNGQYSYTITRRVTLFADHKEINLYLDWSAPSPQYGALMNSNQSGTANTVQNSYTANTISRYP